jgi:hypothetical protein
MRRFLRSSAMTARSIAAIPALLALCLALSACASAGGGGGDGVSVSSDGILTRAGAQHGNMGFVYADKGCAPFALDGGKTLDLLGNPLQVVDTNDYIGTAIYAVPVGSHQLMVRSVVSVGGIGREAFPVTPLTVRARHFYGIDCAHNGGTVDISVTDRDHLGSRNE